MCSRLYKYSCSFKVWFYDVQCLETPALQHFLSSLLTSASVPLCLDSLPSCFYQHHQVVWSHYKLENWSAFFQKPNMYLFMRVTLKRKKKTISFPVFFTMWLYKRPCQNNKRWCEALLPLALLLKKYVSDARPSLSFQLQ